MWFPSVLNRNPVHGVYSTINRRPGKRTRVPRTSSYIWIGEWLKELLSIVWKVRATLFSRINRPQEVLIKSFVWMVTLYRSTIYSIVNSTRDRKVVLGSSDSFERSRPWGRFCLQTVRNTQFRSRFKFYWSQGGKRLPAPEEKKRNTAYQVSRPGRA